MSTTTDSTRTLKTAATACRWIGLAMLVAALIMMIAHVTSLMAYIPVIVVALGAIVGGVVVRSRIQAADGQR